VLGLSIPRLIQLSITSVGSHELLQRISPASLNFSELKCQDACHQMQFRPFIAAICPFFSDEQIVGEAIEEYFGDDGMGE
jgi:hypothetical protein